jgi:pilus assembly protein FimV
MVAVAPKVATAPAIAPVAPVTPAASATPPSAPPAAAPAATASTPQAKPAETTKTEPAKPEPAPAEAAAKTEATPPTAAQPEVKAAEAEPAPAPAAAPAQSVPAPAAKASQPAAADNDNSSLVAIGAGLLALFAGLIIFLVSRRGRRPADKPAGAAAAATEAKTEPVIPAAAPAAATMVAAAAPAPVATAGAEAVAPTVASVTDMVDAIEEAQVFLDHGSDEQAEKVLREALAKHDGRDDIRVKIAEILAARGDKAGFDQLVTELRQRTGGKGELWQRVTQLGAALAGAHASQAQSASATESATPHKPDNVVDFNLDGPSARKDTLGNTADLLLQQEGAGAEMEKTLVLPKAAPKVPAPPAAAESLPNIDFELPQAGTAAAKPAEAAATKPQDEARGLDFKIDFSTISLSLDDKSAEAINPAFEVKSAQWEEVQQKFDLAHAYQEMGDKDGMLEVLQEIEREGDAAQKAAAQKMIGELK